LSACTSEVDADGDGHDAIDCGGDDCDDADPRRFPGNVELCDEEHLDEDCDPETYGARDVDQDGFDDATCCNVESDDTLRCGSDCDDSRPTVHPTAPEACDGLDNDCNGAIDDASLRVYCVDADGDGFGDPARPVSTACPGPDLSALCTDCDDLRSARNPGNPEVCDGVPDNDCDSATNPFDEDGDGYDRASCGGNDCNDLKVSVYPGAPQLCDGYDNTCALGGGVLATEDFDNDGFAPMGAVCSGGPLPALDCNDGSPVVHPLATELCNGIDDNCDGRLDEEPAVSQDCNRPGSVGACVSGACTLLGCTGTFLNCDGLAYNGCEADTLISAAHCGRCDRACASGAACTGGTCACPTGTTTCGDGSGACVDLQTSTANCGDCGHACPAGATCDGGDCNCPFGQILCSGACVDPNVSTDHCGGCGQPCGGGSCTGGRCSCPGGMGAVCDGVCRDLDVDLANCGECGQGCGGGSCAGGDCSCPQGQPTVCGGTCTNTVTDPNHCGGCGEVCGTAGGCQASRCDAVVEIAASENTCVLRGLGGIACSQRTGAGTSEMRALPPSAPVASSVAGLTGTGPHRCALFGSDVRYLESGAWSNVILTDVDQIRAGGSHICAVRAGRVWCWGSNESGQVGHPTAGSLSTPYLIEGVSDIVDVSLGGAHTCALDGAGDVWCWGHNGAGQCGNGSAAPITLTPTRFDVPFDVARLFAAHNRTCVQTALGEAYCAGWNGRGEILGRPEGPSILTPVRAADLDGAESIVGGYEHVCALIQGRVWCRGRGDNGSLGDGTFLASSTLVAAVGLTGVSEIVAGNYHSCALVGGTLRCWGLADGYGVSRNSGVPVQVPGLP
jgi:hypothetical protein